jgi:hypothetical protein
MPGAATVFPHMSVIIGTALLTGTPGIIWELLT